MEVFIPYLKLRGYNNFNFSDGDGLIITKGDLIWVIGTYFTVKHKEEFINLSKKDFLSQIILLML